MHIFHDFVLLLEILLKLKLCTRKCHFLHKMILQKDTHNPSTERRIEKVFMLYCVELIWNWFLSYFDYDLVLFGLYSIHYNVSQVMQGSSHPYFTIKLKLAVDEYIRTRLMLNKSSEVTTDIFRPSLSGFSCLTWRVYRVFFCIFNISDLNLNLLSRIQAA